MIPKGYDLRQRNKYKGNDANIQRINGIAAFAENITCSCADIAEEQKQKMLPLCFRTLFHSTNWEAGRNIPSKAQYEKLKAVLSEAGVPDLPEYEDVIRPFNVP